jgi:hypothetical protein
MRRRLEKEDNIGTCRLAGKNRDTTAPAPPQTRQRSRNSGIFANHADRIYVYSFTTWECDKTDYWAKQRNDENRSTSAIIESHTPAHRGVCGDRLSLAILTPDLIQTIVFQGRAAKVPGLFR